MNRIGNIVWGLILANVSGAAALEIPATDAAVLAGLSAYNWTIGGDGISSTVIGASIALQFHGTRQVALSVNTGNIATKIPSRYPIIAWTVNGGDLRTHQLTANETTVPLSSGVADPAIELYIKGMSPFEDRYTGDVPPNAVKILGFSIDKGGTVTASKHPVPVWLNIGDSIMSGDGAAYAENQGRPSDDSWGASDDGRASYGYLLARHYGFRESRLAYGGYDWGGGLARIPSLSALIDSRTSTASRLHQGKLDPIPSVVLINLGENGIPSEVDVTQALDKIRSRVAPDTKIIVMIPVSGKGRTELTRAFKGYKSAAGDKNAFLVDLGTVAFATCDGVHPTSEGHRAIYAAALPAFDAILGK